MPSKEFLLVHGVQLGWRGAKEVGVQLQGTWVIQARKDGGFAQGEKERSGQTRALVWKSGQDSATGWLWEAKGKGADS